MVGNISITDMYMSVLSSLSVDEKLDLIAKLTNSIRNAHTKERNIEMEDPFACYEGDWGGNMSAEEYADDFLSESIQKHLVRFDIFDIVKQTGKVDRKEVREHWENAKLSFWEQRKCMRKVTDMEKVLGEWFVVFQNAVSYFAEKGVMNQSPLVQSDYELFSCESKNLGKKLKRYCEILSNAPDYIMGEEK
mgnify:CR=1 FL=1